MLVETPFRGCWQTEFRVIAFPNRASAWECTSRSSASRTPHPQSDPWRARGTEITGVHIPVSIGSRYNTLRRPHLIPQDKMAKLTVDGVGEFEVGQGKRLVLALEDEAGVDQLHACGGNARCTTCRVEFLAGEPDQMTVAEKQVLAARGLSGVRLSCQILCDHDMSVRIISRLAGSGRKDVGSRPADDIQPQPVQLVPK